ncbi:hypothetical protein J1N10_00960 [Carboxylicivirga sp. A043]|uniref:hypothetical protein n=1 Tax=Carboxylicivirga litoralis TaxID=2816963 RepID=UPI0021CB61E9|nr:hypothetical protein [Carboxylicivirga sp. A043]MCU4154523.1 hypothetical protein [Carboxylicivirga sp. A043]
MNDKKQTSAKSQINNKNAYINVYPKILTIQIGENWNDFKANCFTVDVYDSSGSLISEPNTGYKLKYLWQVSDSSSIKMDYVRYSHNIDSVIDNMKRPVGNREGLYSATVEVYNEGPEIPDWPDRLRAEVVVNIRKDPHGFWDNGKEIKNNWPNNREKVVIEISPFDDDEKAPLTTIKIGDTLSVKATVKTYTTEAGRPRFGHRIETKYYGKILNPSIEWGYTRKIADGEDNMWGKFALKNETNSYSADLIATTEGYTFVTATYKNQTTKRFIRIARD